MSRPVISLSSVEMVYETTDGTVTAVQDANLDVSQGEFVTLVGPSGCGKSTLLQVISGLIEPTSGHVDFSPQDGSSSKHPDQVGMVFQKPVLLPWRTVLANVMLPVEALRLPKARYHPVALELLKMLGLQDFANRYPYELSGGMQQRASIARALVHEPSVILMDEPFSALDAITREQLNGELRRLWRETGKTILFVTHSIPEAVFLATRVVVMSPRPGRISEVIDIDLPEDRDMALTTTPQFGAYADRIRTCLNGT